VLPLALEVVVPGVMAASAFVASGGGPLTFGGRVVMANFVAPGALYQGGGCACPDEFNTSTEHTDALARRSLARAIVLVKDGGNNCGGRSSKVGWVALPVWSDAEDHVREARIGSDGGVEFVGRVYDLRVSFPAGDVDPPELDPSPARCGDYACRFGSGEVATKRRLVGADNLGREVPREPENEVARLLHRFGPPASEDDGGGADEGVKGALGRLSDVDWAASAEGFFHFGVFRSALPDDHDVREA
jgi:hypothetical protein